MKRIFFIILFALTGYSLFSQCSIRIYTDLGDETSNFLVFLNDEQQDAYPTDDMLIEDLLPGKFDLRVSFDSDTIADWMKSIELKKNEQLVFKVVKMKELGKDVGKVGRGVGKMTGKTEEDQAEDLIQYYKLEKVKND